MAGTDRPTFAVFRVVVNYCLKNNPWINRAINLCALTDNDNNLYLPSAVFIAQRLVGPSKQLKQIIQIIIINISY